MSFQAYEGLADDDVHDEHDYMSGMSKTRSRSGWRRRHSVK